MFLQNLLSFLLHCASEPELHGQTPHRLWIPVGISQHGIMTDQRERGRGQSINSSQFLCCVTVIKQKSPLKLKTPLSPNDHFLPLPLQFKCSKLPCFVTLPCIQLWKSPFIMLISMTQFSFLSAFLLGDGYYFICIYSVHVQHVLNSYVNTYFSLQK